MFRQLVSEICEWRLAQYVARAGVSRASQFRMKINHTRGRPILMLDRSRTKWIPADWQPVTIDGAPYEANFVKIAINVVRRSGTTQNTLPEILQRWFGPSAGQPGTRHFVSCEKAEQGLTFRPVVVSEEIDGSP
jgi:hypothetical protein